MKNGYSIIMDKAKKVGKPNIFVDRVWIDDFSSQSTAFEVIKGFINPNGGNHKNPRIRRQDLRVIDLEPDAEDSDMCAVSIWTDKLDSIYWYSAKYPDNTTPLFRGYNNGTPPANRPTYFIDADSQLKELEGRGCFSSNGRLTYFKAEGVEIWDNQAFIGTSGTGDISVLELPNLTQYTNFLLHNYRYALDYLYIPNLLPNPNELDTAFGNFNSQGSSYTRKVLYLHPDWETAENGSIPANLQTAINRGADVRYVTNFDTPNPVTDLNYSDVTSGSVKLQFTTPVEGENSIDFYEVWVNDGTGNVIQEHFPLGEVFNPDEWVNFRTKENDQDGAIQASVNGGIGTSLKPNTTYTLKVRTVDWLRNKSEFSNEIQFTTLNE